MLQSYVGHTMGKHFADDNASCAETVIKSALGSVGLVTAESIALKIDIGYPFKIFLPNIIAHSLSAGLLAYINYEDKTSELETDDNVAGITELEINPDILSIEA